MIFTPEHSAMNAAGTKTNTRRVQKEGDSTLRDEQSGAIIAVFTKDMRIKYAVGHDYANQPGRGKPANGRIQLLAIRDERLQDISSADMTAEGYPIFTLLSYPLSVRLRGQQSRFAEAWDSIVPRKDRWEKNRPVWVLVYKFVEGSAAE